MSDIVYKDVKIHPNVQNMPSTHHAVLLGSAGTGTAFAAACSLRRVWSQSVTIVAMDINPRHLVTTSLLADHFEQVPISASPEFSTKLLEIMHRYKVDTYMPLFPEEIMLAAKLHENKMFPENVSIIVPPVESSLACADKWKLCELLISHGIPVPRTALASAPFSAKEYYIKPRNGTGSRGARKLCNADLANLDSSNLSDYIVQEVCDPPEITVDAFFEPASSFCHAICRERIELKSGVSTKCRLFYDKELTLHARSLAVLLKLEGSFCFQVMRNPTGWAITDVNPRPGAATAMCAVVGNDFFAATFALRWGQDSRRFFRALDNDHFITRQYAEFLMPPKA